MFFKYLRLQSFPIFGTWHKHCFLLSHIALPGQSMSELHVTISLHLVLGSGSATVPSGHSQRYVPGRFVQTAPKPQLSGFVHSSISLHFVLGFPVYPVLHWQAKVPGRFVQMEFSPHRPLGPFNLSHSLISKIGKRLQYNLEI